MRLRQNDPDFLEHVESFWNILLPKLKPFMHSEGGPILMAQVRTSSTPPLCPLSHACHTYPYSNHTVSCTSYPLPDPWAFPLVEKRL